MMNAIRRAREAHRRAIEALYEDTCTIIEYRAVTDEDSHLTKHGEAVVLEDQLCKLSFESMAATSEGDNAAEQSIGVKLFLAPEIAVKAGSKIVVTHNGETVAYSNSGVAGKYVTHQEIALKLFERWA